MSDVKTRPSEQYYIKHILHTFKSEKSVLIEIMYYYPISPRIYFGVYSWYYGEEFICGRVYRDGTFDVKKSNIIMLLDPSERRNLAERIYDEADIILELVE
ncbi:hypothetical protein [Leptospira interrogans]|uniref:hypothetical protein n=1 Tax=Leptospira interrogans TaxID=173 RepID=UPI00046C4EA4|nr:hypothetical protein [Leptospira interrogans]UMQ60553.1 hypothetical protein FH585_21185 [Leptospira interrogans]